MVLKISFQQDAGTPKVITIPVNAVATLENFRQTIMVMTQVATSDGTSFTNQYAPRYADVQSMIIGEIKRLIVAPAIVAFPPASVTTAQAAFVAAQTALANAQAAAAASLDS